jgi:hypothetical protein
MHFILEESSWAWDGEDRLTYIEQIERLLDRLDVADERGEGVTASRELLEQKIAGAPLAEVLWQGDGPPRPPSRGQRAPHPPT